MKKRKKLDMPLSIKILLLLTGILVAASFIVPIVHPIDLGDTDLPNRLAKPSIFGFVALVSVSSLDLTVGGQVESLLCTTVGLQLGHR